MSCPPWADAYYGDSVALGLAAVRRSRGCLSGPRLGSPFIPCPLLIAGCVLPEDHGDEAHIPVRQESGFSASFPTAVGHTHWDWSSSNPALPLRGRTRERLSALDAEPHVASSACYCPLNPFGRRSADRLTRLLPAGSGLSRQDQTNLYHGAPLRSDDTEADWAEVASVDNTDARVLSVRLTGISGQPVG